jgi:ribonuclease M5
MKIKEVIVVEGKDDTVAIKRAVTADTIETNGSAINKQTLEMIKHAQQSRGVIILTDPDFPGQRIRSIISEHIPGCKHAFIRKEAALAKKGKGLGIEHASPQVIRDALENVKQEMDEEESEISWDDLIAAGLTGGQNASDRRRRLGEILKIGYTNGKQLHKRLKMFKVSKEKFIEAYTRVIQEEKQ